jgi:two-component system chemotaxis sensor kinase CheA
MTNDRTDKNDEFVAQFLDDFYSECDELLTLIRRSLLVLEDSLDGRAFDRRLLDELFRSFHTLKGISGMVTLSAAETLAHSLESYLRELREGNATINSQGFDALAAGVSTLESVIQARRNNQDIPNIDAIVERIDEVVASPNAEKTGSTYEPGQSTSTEAVRQWQVEFTPSAQLAEREVNLNSVRARLQELGELVSAKPVIKGAGEIAFEFVLATNASETLFAGLKEDGLVFLQMEAVKVDQVNETKDTRPITAAAPTSVVRVDLARLDELMQMIGELVISRTRLEEQLIEMKRTLPAASWRPLQETSLAMERQLRNLRESVMRVRMVQIGEIFERMQFVVRDLARESGKKIDVQISGGETEIDKYLVERMMEPLLHLVRNAVSHGLETVNERQKEGKSSEGLLTLSAMTAGEAVVIKIADDGRGIDRERVIARARENSLVLKNTEVDDATLLDLICSPGLSTRDGADRESGRGVGMDVVRNVVEDLGGHLSLSTLKGEGTAFTIELPLTLAIAEALIVSVNGQRFAVPQSSVREVLEVDPRDTRVIENNEIISYRGGVLPLVRLAKLFDMEYQREKSFHVFIVGDDTNTLGVGVDRILGQREIVVRGISDPLAQVKGISGATELGDQRVVLILDVAALRQFALNARH